MQHLPDARHSLLASFAVCKFVREQFVNSARLYVHLSVYEFCYRGLHLFKRNWYARKQLMIARELFIKHLQ